LWIWQAEGVETAAYRTHGTWKKTPPVSDLGTSSWAGSWAAPNGLGLLAKPPKPATTNMLDSGYEQLGLDLGRSFTPTWSGAFQFAVTKLFGTGSQMSLLLVIDAI
jgi:hypothetical protein